MSATGETEPTAAPQRHGIGQDGVVEEQLVRQQRAEVVGEIVRRRGQRACQQQQQNVADDERRRRRWWRGGRWWRDEFDRGQLARVHRHVAVVQPAVTARRRFIVHQADTQRHAAHTATARRVPPEFR